MGGVWGSGKSWADALSMGPEEPQVQREQKYSWNRKTEGLGSETKGFSILFVYLRK